MKSLENQKLPKVQEEEIEKQKDEIKEIETLDKITQKRVINNFNFYFQNLLALLKNRKNVSLKQLAQYITQNYGEKNLYNGDFIAFTIYLNRKKKIEKSEDEIFSEFHFAPILVTPDEDELDLGNGLKITNLDFKLQ